MSDTNKKLLTTGITGTVVAALCCFTPVLVILFGAIGLSAWLGWIDYVLFPALGIFVLLTIYAVYQRSRQSETSTD
jgi:mercuric ion transport protein